MVTRFDEHVHYQHPNEFTCVNLLLNAIECKDPILNTTIETVKEYKEPTGEINKF